MADSKILVPFVKSWEGKFVNDPYDRGGATMAGITLATFRKVFGENKTVEDLKNMTDEQWHHVFKKYYWDKCKADEIADQSIANMIVDWYWGSGAYAIKIPQYILGLKQDGIIGPKTLAAINNYKGGAKALFDKLWKERANFYGRIAKGTQKRFLRGWLNRLAGHHYGSLVCNGGKVMKF